MGHCQSGHHKAFYSGKDNLRRRRVALIQKQNMVLTARGYTARSKQITSIILPRNPINMTNMHVYALTTEAAADESESFYSGIQEETAHTPKRDMLLMKGDWNAK